MPTNTTGDSFKGTSPEKKIQVSAAIVHSLLVSNIH